MVKRSVMAAFPAGVKRKRYSCHNTACGKVRLTGLILALMGSMVLLNNLGKPRIEALHGSEILGLVASGMCFGVAVVGLLGRLRLPEK